MNRSPQCTPPDHNYNLPLPGTNKIQCLFFTLDEIGLTGHLHQKVKCENKPKKTKLSFPRASHCSDTLCLDSKLLLFSETHPEATHCSSPASHLPSSCQPAQASAQALPKPGAAAAARGLLLWAPKKWCQRPHGQPLHHSLRAL